MSSPDEPDLPDLPGLPAYELFRLQLEEQLRRDFGLLYQAHLTKLRAYETVARARGEIDAGLPPLALSLNLAGLLPAGSPAPAVPSPAQLPAAAPAPPAPAPAEPAAAAPPQAVAPPAGKGRRPKRKKDPDHQLHNAVFDALGQLGPSFTKQDLCRVLGFQPSRTTLHSVLEYLVSDGTLTLAERGWGTVNVYRQGPPPPADPEPPA